MLFSMIVIGVLLGMKFNGMIGAPWWVVVVSVVFLIIFGLILNGNLDFKVSISDKDK